MGFFSDLKEDLSQAVNELVSEEELDKEKESEEVVIEETTEEAVGEVTEENTGLDLSDMETLDAMLERVDSIELPEDMDITKLEGSLMDIAEGNIESVEEPEKDTIAELLDELEAKESEDVTEEFETEEFETEELAEIEEPDEEAEVIDAEVESVPEVTEEVKENDKKEEKRMEIRMSGVKASDETAVITGGMIITGDITSEGSMDVIGCINGNIDILGKLNVTGTIQGNSKAAEIFADNAQITGEITSDGSVKIGQSSVIIGNITATSAVIAGAVKGDIDVKGPVILDTSAIVMGNIKSKSVQINNGAVIEGLCSQCYADVNPTAFFEDLKKNK